ncbi:MAG: AfsR/SARP family transcriptional regulator, partial [Gemmatimonadales bacterium]
MMLRLRTFGGLVLERDGTPLAGPASQRRRLALLAYLAGAGDRPVPRDKLIAVLWPERDAERGRHSLSQLIYSLRNDLGAAVVLSEADDVRLSSSLIESDLRQFERAMAGREWAAAAEL